MRTRTEALTIHKKWSVPLRISSVSVTKETADLATFTEKIPNGILHFLCSVKSERIFDKKW